MGLFDILKGATHPPTIVANNAVKQYRKAIAKGWESNLIAQGLWTWRYLNVRLDSKSESRYISYIMDKKFTIATMVDFCLSSLDIEFLYGPKDLDNDVYRNASYTIINKLSENNVPASTKDMDDFLTKWHKLIEPLR